MPSRGNQGFGLLKSSLVVAPDQAAALAKVVKEAAAGLGDQGVSEDELQPRHGTDSDLHQGH